MSKAEEKQALNQYVSREEALQQFPLFYRYFEFYKDEIALDVENCNMVYSTFHQSPKHNIGFSSKKAALLKLDAEKIIFKLQ